MKTPPPAIVAPQMTEAQRAEAIAERINKMELRRIVLHNEIDHPPEKVNAYYFSDRETEMRILTLTVDAVKDLIH